MAFLRRDAAATVEPGEPTLAGAVQLYRVLRYLAAHHDLDALTVRCFDLLEEVGNTACVALSRLNDEGLTAACEGDLPATLTMMALSGIAGRACFMANPSDFDTQAGTVTFGHCSVPRSIVASHRLRSHFESGRGVGLEGHFPPGEMTVARIGGRDLKQARVWEGSVVTDCPSRDDLCRTQVVLRLPGDAREVGRCLAAVRRH